MDYSNKNAAPVLAEVDKLIADYERRKKAIDARRYSYWETKPRMKGYNMDDVYKRLSIFDWWVDTLSYSHLLKMRSFLSEAIKLGYSGYVCFKVGASGCANGMWAHKDESVDGYSPSTGEALYHSFTPDYCYWSFTHNGEWFPQGREDDKFMELKRASDLERAMKNHGLI